MAVSIFRVDQEGLSAARAHLGIHGDVRISLRRMSVAARYVSTSITRNGLLHRLALNARLMPTSAEHSAWHELAHVHRAEQMGGYSKFEAEWIRQFDASGLSYAELNAITDPGQVTEEFKKAYYAIPLEAEAERVAKRRPDRIRVTVPR